MGVGTTIPNRLKGLLYMDAGDGRGTSGRVFWVSNASGAGGSDNNSGTGPDQPVATVDYAVGLCTAGRGDVIRVMEGHAETLATATALALDVAGVRVIGMGSGALRPTFTFATATTAVIAVTVANIEISNCIFVCNIASQTRMISLAGGADGANIHHNLFREGTATGLSMIEWTGAADDVQIEDNQFYAPTAGNYDEAILIASTPTRGHIRRNYIYGDWDEGGINNAVGNIATAFAIGRNKIANLNATGVPCINLDSAVTGICYRNLLGNSVSTLVLDAGDMFSFDNRYVQSGDFTDSPALPPSDTTNNLIGVDDADNAADTTLVAANQDGSILERLEQIQESTNRGTGTSLAANESLADVLYAANGIAVFPAAQIPANNVSIAEVLREIYDQQDKAVSGSAATLVNGTTVITIAGGPIEILSLVAVCVTGNDTTASTLQWSADPTAGAAATFSGASASLASALAGATIVLQGNTLATAPLVNTSGVGLGQTVTNGIIVAAGIITTTVAVGSTTGTWRHFCRYRPLDRGITVTAA